MKFRLDKLLIIVFLGIILIFSSNNINAEENNTYFLETEIEGAGELRVTPEQEEYELGSEVILEAISDEGWQFLEWSGDLEGSKAIKEVTISEDLIIEAKFVELESEEYIIEIYTLDGGTVNLEPNKDRFEAGDEVTVEAIAEEGWEFTGWSGSLADNQNPVTIIIDENQLLHPNFIEDEKDYYSSNKEAEDNEVSEQEDGSERSSFIIESLADLESIGEAEYALSADYKLGSDIDATKTQDSDYNDGKGWETIGGLDEAFTGSFDGQGHKITGLNIKDSNADNLGLFGMVEEAEITNLTLKDVKISGNRYLGALAGQNFASKISNVSVTGDITGEYYVGQLLGYNFQGVVEQAYASGSLSANMVVGGLVGDNNGIINNSFASTKVEGIEMVGGLVGINGEGEVASDEGIIKNSYAKGEVRGDFRTGGLVGANNWVGQIEDSYWNIETSGLEQSDGGQGLTSSEMRDRNNYKNWDFNNIWYIDNDYPKLRWME